ncbi:MAG: KEOPS complex subunit Pcc1 [Candidatus Bathycorpusculaceae bacterium]
MKAVIRLKFPSKKHLETFVKALEPEVKKPATTRSRANVEKENASLILKVEARDTVALRATLNTYLRWVNSMANVLEVLKNDET